jgi:hypothetical protein
MGTIACILYSKVLTCQLGLWLVVNYLNNSIRLNYHGELFLVCHPLIVSFPLFSLIRSIQETFLLNLGIVRVRFEIPVPPQIVNC